MVKKSIPGHTSLMTVALSFILESLPENIVFFVIVNRGRETTEGERGELLEALENATLYLNNNRSACRLVIRSGVRGIRDAAWGRFGDSHPSSDPTN